MRKVALLFVALTLCVSLARAEMPANWDVFSEDPDSKISDTWAYADGVVICKGTPRGYAYTKTKYTDFVFELEWRWPEDKKPGAAGVLVRMTGEHKIWPKSFEAQINSPDAGDIWGLVGYQLEGPAERSKSLEHPQFGKLTNVKKAKQAEKPAGEWNKYKITAKGDTITLEINGQIVNRATGCETKPGRICLTSEGDEIHFRNVKLNSLD